MRSLRDLAMMLPISYPNPSLFLQGITKGITRLFSLHFYFSLPFQSSFFLIIIIKKVKDYGITG